MPAAVVIVAAGSGTRVGADVNKVLLPLGDVPCSPGRCATRWPLDDVRRVVVVVRDGEQDAVAEALAPHLGDARGPARRRRRDPARVRVGGPAASSRRRIEAARSTSSRSTTAPARSPGRDLFDATLAAAREHGGAIPVVPVHGLLTTDAGPGVGDARRRTDPAGVPRRPAARGARRRGRVDGFEGTDTAACFARYAGGDVAAVPSSPLNLKITFPEDVALATRLVAAALERLGASPVSASSSAMSSAEVTRRAAGGASTSSIVWWSRRRATSAARSWPGKSSSAGTTDGGSTTGDTTGTSSPSRSTVSPTSPSSTRLTVSVTGRMATTTASCVERLRRTQRAMKSAGRHRAERVVQHDGLVGASHGVPR